MSMNHKNLKFDKLELKNKSYFILIPGELKSINIENETLVILEKSHYTQGSRFRAKTLNGLIYLKYEDQFVTYKENQFGLTNSFDDLNSFITIEMKDREMDLFFKLKWGVFYFNQNLEIIRNQGEEGFRFMWGVIEILPNEDYYERLVKSISNNNTDTYSEFISIEGINLINNDSQFPLFNITFNNEFTKHLCYYDSDPQITFHIGDYQSSWQIEPQLVKGGEIALFLKGAGYLSVALDTITNEVLPVFIEDLNPDIITLKSTGTPTEYKLYSKADHKWVTFINNPIYALGILTEEEEEACIIRFYAVDREQYYTKHSRKFHERQVRVCDLIRAREREEADRIKRFHIEKIKQEKS